MCYQSSLGRMDGAGMGMDRGPPCEDVVRMAEAGEGFGTRAC